MVNVYFISTVDVGHWVENLMARSVQLVPENLQSTDVVIGVGLPFKEVPGELADRITSLGVRYITLPVPASLEQVFRDLSLERRTAFSSRIGEVLWT